VIKQASFLLTALEVVTLDSRLRGNDRFIFVAMTLILVPRPQIIYDKHRITVVE
jgi:hypothetical protein